MCIFNGLKVCTESTKLIGRYSRRLLLNFSIFNWGKILSFYILLRAFASGIIKCCRRLYVGGPVSPSGCPTLCPSVKNLILHPNDVSLRFKPVNETVKYSIYNTFANSFRPLSSNGSPFATKFLINYWSRCQRVTR